MMMKKKRRYFFIPFLFTLCRITPAYGFLTDTCEVHTFFETAVSSSELCMMPGEVLKTEDATLIGQYVSVKNTSPGSAYIRALVLTSLDLGVGSWTLVGTGPNWYYNAADGYFYYMQPVGSGETTSALMEGIRIEDAGEETMETEIYVYEECIWALSGVSWEEAWRL